MREKKKQDEIQKQITSIQTRFQQKSYYDQTDLVFDVECLEDVLVGLVSKVYERDLKICWTFVPAICFRDYFAELCCRLPMLSVLKQLKIEVCELEKNYYFKYYVEKHYKVVSIDDGHSYLSIKANGQIHHAKRMLIYTKTEMLYKLNLDRSGELLLMNLRIPKNQQIFVGTDSAYQFKLKKHDKFIYTWKQRWIFFRKKVRNFNEEIVFKEKGTTSPQKLIILNPYKQTANSKTPLIVLDYPRLGKFQNCNFISLVDKWETYCLYNDYDEFIFEKYVDLIKNRMNKYQLLEEDLIFVGFSKGGTMCLNFYKYFPESYYVVGIPQLNLLKFAYNQIYGLTYISKTLFAQTIDFLNHELMIEEFIESPKTFCFFAKDDYLSNANFEPPAKLTVDACHDQAAYTMQKKIVRHIYQLVKNDWVVITSIIAHHFRLFVFTF
ncbi:MAG: hypothetical protein ACRCUP_01585 [Mycoplasmatales bacterium]